MAQDNGARDTNGASNMQKCLHQMIKRVLKDTFNQLGHIVLMSSSQIGQNIILLSVFLHI